MKQYSVKFGGTESEQDELAHLVLMNQKNATSSLYFLQTIGYAEATQVDEIWQILDSQDQTICCVQVVKVVLHPYGSITSTFAREEGDGTLENWQKIHQPYYAKLLKKYDQELTKETLLECVHFKKISEE